eukprot:1477027-Alexandrium_andersonii.AAC.1
MPLRDGGFGFPELQVLAAPAYLGSWARVSSTVTEAVGWDTLDPAAPSTLGKASYQAAWDNLKSYGLEEWDPAELQRGPSIKAQAHLARAVYKQKLAWAIGTTTQAERALRADLATPGSAVLLTATPAEAGLSLTDPEYRAMARTRLAMP